MKNYLFSIYALLFWGMQLSAQSLLIPADQDKIRGELARIGNDVYSSDFQLLVEMYGDGVYDISLDLLGAISSVAQINPDQRTCSEQLQERFQLDMEKAQEVFKENKEHVRSYKPVKAPRSNPLRHLVYMIDSVLDATTDALVMTGAVLGYGYRAAKADIDAQKAHGLILLVSEAEQVKNSDQKPSRFFKQIFRKYLKITNDKDLSLNDLADMIIAADRDGSLCQYRSLQHLKRSVKKDHRNISDSRLQKMINKVLKKDVERSVSSQ